MIDGLWIDGLQIASFPRSAWERRRGRSASIRAAPTRSVDARAFPRGAWERALPICNLQFAICNSLLLLLLLLASSASASMVETIDRVQPKIVKLYGVGGFQGMKGYQTGILISPEGHILTAYSYVLDADPVTAVLADGRRFDAKLLGADPRLEVAVLKIEAAGLPCFDLRKAVKAEPGARVLALSNSFNVAVGNEPASVQKGTVSVVARLEARRGVFETPYHGPVYVLDVTTNNPGAAGGALVTRRGELAGMLGKELRNSLNNTWLNYAVPIDELRQSVEEIRAGKFVARRDAETEKKPQRSLSSGVAGDRAGSRRDGADAALRGPRAARFARGQGGHPARRSDRALGRAPDPVVQGPAGRLGVRRL